MDPEFYNDYMKIEENEENSIGKKLFGKNINLKTFYNGVRRACNVLRLENGIKINWIIDKLQEGEKSLVFSHWKSAGIQLVMKRLKELHIPYEYIDGSRSSEARERAKKSFNSGKIKILLISKAGGEGLDLVETKNVIICDPGWNEGAIRQVIGRAARYLSHANLPKEKQVVYVYQLFMDKPDNTSGRLSIDIYYA